MLKSEKGGYAGYIGLKIVMALGAAVVVGIVSGIVILILLIPAGGVGALVVLAGKAAGLQWNLYTITTAVVVGTGVLGILLYVVSLISVPPIVFFPAYSIYFFASRYPALQTTHRHRGQSRTGDGPYRGHQQQYPQSRGDQPWHQEQDRGQGDHRAVVQRAARLIQAGSEPRQLANEMRTGHRGKEPPAEDEGGQQRQQGPAPADRRHQRDDDREFDNGVDE